MSQLFSPRSNTLFRVAIVGFFIFITILIATGYILQSSSYVTEVAIYKHQPVPFSHEHHVNGLGIDCRYCHYTVEKSANATIPPPGLCMNCHKKIWADSEMLKPIRDAFKNDTPIRWKKVHDLPDFVYFNHSIHVNHGIGCVSCHGKINEMPLTSKAQRMYMGWCLDCHRNPESQFRPLADITNMYWKPPESWKKTDKYVHLGVTHFKEGTINQRTNCYICHR